MAAIESQLVSRRTPSLVTADELLRMPGDDRYELIRGELIPLAPSPGGEHGNTIQKIGARASVYAEDHELGETFAAETGFKVHVDPDTVRGPDWAFICKDRLSGPITKKHVPIVPDIVLDTAVQDSWEVLSWTGSLSVNGPPS